MKILLFLDDIRNPFDLEANWLHNTKYQRLLLGIITRKRIS